MAIRVELEAVQRGVVSHEVWHGCFQRSHYARDNFGPASSDDETRTPAACSQATLASLA
jgi:hypothetical protein